MTDTVTGLIWLKQADCMGVNNWAGANGAAAGLKAGDCSLTDGSSPGDWRLPTMDEWSATIARAVALGCVSGGAGGLPSVTNDAGTGCLLSGGASFAGVPVMSVFYWSSSANEAGPSSAWFENLGGGNIPSNPKGLALRVWPVRGGPR